MNEGITKLREIVERATAAPTDAADDLDAETASLRRGWLQLGKLIEEDIGVSGVQAGNGRVRVPQPAARRKPAWPLWIAASTASLLVAMGIAFAVRFFAGPHEPQKNLPPIARSNVPPKQPAAPAVVRMPAPPQANQPNPHIAKASDHLQWGDSVDDEISAVGEATIYAKQDVFAQSSGVLEIETGLDELTKEVEQGSL